MSKSWKYFFGSLAVVFLLFCYWQINDSDPLLWIPVYFVVSITAGFASFGKINVNVSLILTFIYLIGAIFFWPDNIFGWLGQEWQQKDLSMKTDAMETNREFFGLVTSAVVFILEAIKGRKIN